MPAIIPYTDDELRANVRALETALANGEKTVQFSDRSVTYNSAAEILERIEYFNGLLTQSISGSTVPRRSKQTFGVATKGF